MAKKKMTPDERAEEQARSADLTRRLEERIAYNKALLAEVRAAAERREERRRRLKRLLGLGFLGAD